MSDLLCFLAGAFTASVILTGLAYAIGQILDCDERDDYWQGH